MSMKAAAQEVGIPADGVSLAGTLALPASALGVVVFAHGSGSSRFSPRNRFVADELLGAHVGTLLFDLLTLNEDRDSERRFDIDLLTRRLLSATDWLDTLDATRDLRRGYFGASTGAAAALQAAAKLGDRVAAVVSRGGRPDLAGAALLRAVTAPTLLIVGGADDVVIELNKRAFSLMNCRKEIRIVDRATHLFEEPGTLEQVAEAAAEWFGRFLC
jgi:pimeloyl-ACP methyl ester carboxylesterase